MLAPRAVNRERDARSRAYDIVVLATYAPKWCFLEFLIKNPAIVRPCEAATDSSVLCAHDAKRNCWPLRLSYFPLKKSS